MDSGVVQASAVFVSMGWAKNCADSWYTLARSVVAIGWFRKYTNPEVWKPCNMALAVWMRSSGEPDVKREKSMSLCVRTPASARSETAFTSEAGQGHNTGIESPSLVTAVSVAMAACQY